jgi:hypothetical protein
MLTVRTPDLANRPAMAASRAKPFEITSATKPWLCRAATIVSQSGRMSGSPPDSVTSRTPNSARAAQAATASSVESSLARGRPAQDPQWMQAASQARVTSQTQICGVGVMRMASC